MDQRASASRVGTACGAVGIVLGLTSWLLPFFASAFVAPAGLAFAIIALAYKATGLGLTGLIVSGLGVLMTVSKVLTIAH